VSKGRERGYFNRLLSENYDPKREREVLQKMGVNLVEK